MNMHREIREKLDKMPPDQRKEALAVLDRIAIDISEGDSGLTGFEPSGFGLEGKTYDADHHRDIFLKVCEIAASKHPDKHNAFFEIRGRKRIYFSTNPNDLSSNDYRKINGTKIYAELNENASTLKKRSEQVIAKFNMDLSTFKIF